MTTEELAELFLAHLYELADEAPHPNFLFSVNDFLPKFGISDREEVQKAINYLGDRGFIILASFDMLGGISAGITIEGSIFVEKGGETGMIEQYRKNSQTLAKTPSDPSPSPIDQERTEMVNEEKQNPFFARRTVEALLDDIEDVLERDEAVALEAKRDLLSDLATFKIQMGRNVKSRQIIDAVLGNLSSIPSIAPLVTGLNHIVDTYFR
jgi:hypothetical protein